MIKVIMKLINVLKIFSSRPIWESRCWMPNWGREIDKAISIIEIKRSSIIFFFVGFNIDLNDTFKIGYRAYKNISLYSLEVIS